MDHRDDWPDGMLEEDLDAVAERDPTGGSAPSGSPGTRAT